MEILNQPYSEILEMESFFLRGLYDVYKKTHQQPSFNGIDGENTGDIDPNDYDTSMWF